MDRNLLAVYRTVPANTTLQFHRVKLPNRFIPINLGEAKYRTPIDEFPKPLIAAENLVLASEEKPIEDTDGADVTEGDGKSLEEKISPVPEI